MSSAITSYAAEAGEPGPARDRYDSLSRALHWLFAAGIIYASGAGYLLARVADPHLREQLSGMNMSVATVLLILFPLRVGWKLIRKAPGALSGVPVWQRSVAHAVHQVLYGITFVVLVSGYLMVPHGYRWFDVLWIPTPFGKGAVTADFFAVHRIACALLAGLVLVHVLAVVKHQLTGTANVLRRML